MASVSSAVVGWSRSRRARDPVRALWALYGLLAVALAAYLVSLVARGVGDSSTALDGWGVDAFELLVCLLAFARAATRRTRRAVPIGFAAAMLMWALGDVLLTIESLGGASPPTPSLADVFYIAFFPLAYLAVVLMVRSDVRGNTSATWLDGAVAGLGAAALCAAFAFRGVEHLVGGGAAAVATDLAYPIGDVILLALVVGGTVVYGGRRRHGWYLVAAGCALNAFGDTFNLLNTSKETHLGVVVDGIAWPAALLLMSMAVWLRPARSDLLARPALPGFGLPALGATAALAVLLLGSVARVDRVAVGLAAATMLAACVRLALSVESLRRLTEQRRRQSITDSLTGLGNRRRLADVLGRYFDELGDPAAEPRPLAFLFIDLDHFKEVNDSFGHPAGDQLLAQLGPRIKRCLAPADLVARIGGDELVVALVDAGRDAATLLAERLSASLHEPFVLDMVSVRVGASIGIAIAPDDASDPDELMRRADQAMYRAKQTGSDFEVYDRELDSDTDRLRLVEELRVAIAERQFELHYQPQIDLANCSITAVEALLRWPHPRLGQVPPLEFLPLAEEAGLMRSLTDIVLDQALSQCARWRAGGNNLSVSVNVSATNILDADFVSIVRDHLAAHGLPAEALVLEITETTVISDFERCRDVIDDVRALGCVVSIDDFGAGFTSLAYLGRLAVGELKLDRTFLAALAGDGGTQTLVRATIELAHSLGLKVVAEGVEEQSTLELLGRLGCDLAQGYHIGRPAPAAQLDLPTRLAA